MHPKAVIVFCCLAVQLVTLYIVVRREGYNPSGSDPAGKRLTGLRRTMYAINLASWIVIGATQFWH
jgi:uncharacterized PurR-regulated membrane protein YhhQ (DUF165 family)